MNQLIVVGTSHIAQQSIREIEDTFEKIKPDIVALELDPHRFHALLSKKKSKITLSDIKRIGLKGYLFALIGSYLQKKLGRLVGVEPGSEMLTGIKLAQKHKIPLALIDQDINITLSRFSQTLSWKERFNFFVDLLKGIFFRKRELKKLDGFDLAKVPPKQLVNKLMAELKQRYPNIYQTLVHERNQAMIKNLRHLFKENQEKKILAIVGAGHQEAIERAFKSKTI